MGPAFEIIYVPYQQPRPRSSSPSPQHQHAKYAWYVRPRRPSHTEPEDRPEVSKPLLAAFELSPWRALYASPSPSCLVLGRLSMLYSQCQAPSTCPITTGPDMSTDMLPLEAFPVRDRERERCRCVCLFACDVTTFASLDFHMYLSPLEFSRTRLARRFRHRECVVPPRYSRKPHIQQKHGIRLRCNAKPCFCSDPG